MPSPLRRVVLALALLFALLGLGPVAASTAPHQAPAECMLMRASVSDVELRALPFANPECPGARPGAGYLITLRGGTYRCSLAFMFEGSDGKRYFATAGHCLLDDGDPEELTWATAKGPPVRDMQGRPFGRARFARLDDQFDIGLIEIDESTTAPVSPQVCHFGGPTGSATRTWLDPPEVVHHYGFGKDYKDVMRARTGTVADHIPADYFRVQSNVNGGDSGSSLISDDGAALGILVRGISLGSGAQRTGAAYAEASRLDTHLPLAEAALGIEFELVTAPLLPL